MDLVSRIKEVGARHQVTAGQVALAWILARGADFVAIPGTKQIKVLITVLLVNPLLSPHNISVVVC